MKSFHFLKYSLTATLLYLLVKLLVQSSFFLLYVFFFPNINDMNVANSSMQDTIILTLMTCIQLLLVVMLMWRLFVQQIKVFKTPHALRTMMFISFLLSSLFLGTFVYTYYFLK